LSGASPEPRPVDPGAEPGPVDVSIVIVVYRTPDHLRRALDALAAAAPALRWECLVIDNDPGVGGCREVAAGRPGVQYIPNEHNVGFGRACNQGMRMARGRYLFLHNPDLEVCPGSLEALVELADREPDAGLVAPRLHYADGRLQESCRTFYTVRIFLLRRTFLGRLFPGARAIREHLMLDWDHESTREVDWAIGAALLARREAVDDVGLMDERFFMYFEDVDWCYRMHQRGWRVFYHPVSRMVHHWRRESARRPGRGLLVHLGSTFRYYEKWSFLLYWLKLRGRALRNAALLAGDVVLLGAAFVGAYALRAVLGGVLTKPLFGFELYLRFLAFTLVVALVAFHAFGLYRERLRSSLLDIAFPVARALVWTSVLMMAATFLFSVRFFSRFMVVLFFPLAVVLVTLGRVLLVRAVQTVRRRDLNLRRVCILGPPDGVDELMARFHSHGTFGMEPVPLGGSPGQGSDPAAWARRLRVERAQEVVLFEDWPGDVPGLLLELRERGLPVRLVPRLRGVLPLHSSLGEFMGWPAVLVGGEVGGVRRGPGQRLGDIGLALAVGLFWFVPWLVVALGRVVAGHRVTEEVRLRGDGGRPLVVRRLAGGRRAAGAARALLDWYPALPALAAGRVALTGLCPFTEEEWMLLDAAYRELPPEAPAGLVGPWNGGSLGLADIAAWNRRYPENWSAAGDLRIFWRALLARR
jgi:N-acetylglucosaminyl-diphospho-decaprenol L-rhamnosyltransferase